MKTYKRGKLVFISDTHPASDLKNLADRQKILIKGKIDHVWRYALRRSPNKRTVGIVYLRVQRQFLRCCVFQHNYKKLAHLLEDGKVVFLFGCLIKHDWPASDMSKKNQTKYLPKIINYCQVDVRGVLVDYDEKQISL